MSPPCSFCDLVSKSDWRTENPNGNQPGRPEFSNFGQSGRDWERNVNVQIFNPNLESILNQDAGIRIHGNTSRIYNIKSLRLYARSEYDEDNEFDHSKKIGKSLRDQIHDQRLDERIVL